MPGIAGIIRRTPYPGVHQDLRIMVEAMRHGKRYCGNQYVNEDIGLYTGWMGHRGGLADCMPLITRNKNAVLIFQGENYQESEVGARPHPESITKNRDAAHLLELYEQMGDDFLDRLNGWFCGLIADLRTSKVTLFNDRYGMSRIYVHEGENEFLFASEAKSILKVRPALRTIQPESLAQYLRFNCVLGTKTLFKDVFLLPNGSSWVFNGGGPPKRQRYFHFSDWEEQPELGGNDFFEKFAGTVSKIFPIYAQASQKVAMSLTAGLDTRVIMASLKTRDQPLPCYTFGGTWGETFDIRTARKVAKISNQPHEVIRIDEGFFKEFPRFLHRSIYISDGTHDAFGAHDVYFNEIASEIAPIRLTGKFGSEVVRVRKLIPVVKIAPDLIGPGFRSFIAEVPPLEQLTNMRHPLSRVVCEEIPWYEFGRVAVEQSQVVLRTPYMDNELVKLMFQAPAGLRSSGELQARYVTENSPELAAILTNLSRSGQSNWLIKELFYLAFWSLFKAEYIYLFATPHWLTRIDRALERLRLERFLAGRQKFEAYRIWIRTKLADFIRETLLSSKAYYTEIFDRKCVEKMVTRHLAGTHNYLDEINKVLTVELIYSSLLKS
jgi:asparagine synthase (glutamine-hydrolysing)